MNLAELRSRAERLDGEDPLAGFRERFHIPQQDGQDVVYLCGNSLGLAPKAAAASVEREFQAWRDLGVVAHFKAERPWVSFHELCTPHLAKLVGARPHEVVAMNTLTVNLHLMLASFYRPTAASHGILVGPTAFPSDRYAVASQIEMQGFEVTESLTVAEPRPGENCLRTEDVLALIDRHGKRLCLILMDGVNYYTGEFLDLSAIAAAARQHGIMVGFDLAHAVGNVPLKLHDWNVDFAVWCSYKYLNGGPGAPAGCFVHERHGLDPKVPRLAGWWGHEKATRFKMGPEFQPIPGAEGWQLSNPPLFSMAALLPSLELFSEVGIDRLHAKSLALTAFLHDALTKIFPNAVEVLTPADPGRRGCQLSMRWKENGRATFEKLQRAGVVCDWREPDVIRLAPVSLYNRFADVVRCVEVLHG